MSSQVLAQPSAGIKATNLCRHLTVAAQHIPTQLAVAVQQAGSAGSKSPDDAYRYLEWDFATLHQQSDRIAFALNAFGLTQGMKAVLMVTPSLEFFALTFALFKAGIIPILVDPGMGINNLKQCFVDAEPDAFIGIPKAHVARRLFGWGKPSVKYLLNVDSLGESDANARSITHRFAASTWLTGATSLSRLMASQTAHNASRLSEPDSAYPMVMLDQDEMAAILFTSGSTGTPKGVVYSHKMFEAQIQALKQDYGILPGERDLATFPLFSLFGPALGMASIVPDMDASKPITAKPERLFAAIERYQCSNIFVNPALLERLGHAGVQTSHQLPSVKRVISAGAPATISSIARFSKMLSKGVPILNSYGATESLPISMIASDALMATTVVTDTGGGICVGKPIQGVDIKIIAICDDKIPDWDDTLALDKYQIGEIVVKGPMVSQAYYRRDSATLLAKMRDSDGSVRHRMGDLGYFDTHGKLWMCGRKAHRVDATDKGEFAKRYFSIPTERIFNTHASVKRSALVGVNINGDITPLICVELEQSLACTKGAALYAELMAIADKHEYTQGIRHFLIHPDFPVDIRHNAKIFREKLAVWAQAKV